jgi:hypothetical protein
MGGMVGIVVSVVAGVLLATVGGVTLVQLASSSNQTSIQAPLVQYGTR